MRKGIGGQMLDAQDCQGNVTIESHTTTCYCAFKMAIFTAFPEIDEGPVITSVIGNYLTNTRFGSSGRSSFQKPVQQTKFQKEDQFEDQDDLLPEEGNTSALPSGVSDRRKQAHVKTGRSFCQNQVTKLYK